MNNFSNKEEAFDKVVSAAGINPKLTKIIYYYEYNSRVWIIVVKFNNVYFGLDFFGEFFKNRSLKVIEKNINNSHDINIKKLHLKQKYDIENF